MTLRSLSLVLASFTLLGLAAPAHAGKGKGKKKGGAQSTRVLSHLDRDHNGTIDGKEATRVQGLYAALVTLDKDHDGKLSETEIAAVKVPTDTAGKRGKKKKSENQ